MEGTSHCTSLQFSFLIALFRIVFGVSLSLALYCDVRQNEKLLCGGSNITSADCKAKGCCFDEQQCYYGNTVTVQCTRDGQFVVVVARDVTVPNLALSSITLLGGKDSPCGPVSANDAFAVFHFPVTACGTRLKVEGGYVVYENVMSSTYDVVSGPSGSITRDSVYELLFQCWYSGSDFVPLVVEVGTVPPPPPVAAPGPLRVELRLAIDSRYDSYYGAMDYPITKVLREPVFVEVRILERTDPNIALSLGDCWASSTPDPDSGMQWTLLANGCPYKDDNYLTTLVPVNGSSGLPYPTHYERFIVHMFTFVHADHLDHLNERVFIHCHAAVCDHYNFERTEDRCSRQKRDVAETPNSPSRQSVVVSSGEVILSGLDANASNSVQNRSNNAGTNDTIEQNSAEKAGGSNLEVMLADPTPAVSDLRNSDRADLHRSFSNQWMGLAAAAVIACAVMRGCLRSRTPPCGGGGAEEEPFSRALQCDFMTVQLDRARHGQMVITLRDAHGARQLDVCGRIHGKVMESKQRERTRSLCRKSLHYCQCLRLGDMMSSPCSLPPLPAFFLVYLIPSLLLSPSRSHSPLRWTSSQDPCYHPDGRPRHCLSEFINAAYSIPVHVADSRGRTQRNVSLLTDLHNPHNLTCWVGEGAGGDWTLVVPLGRRFEVTYISLQFCQQGELPNWLSISIFKSMDHGSSWRPLQFYSADCSGKFGHPARTSAPSRHHETEPLCSDPRPLQRHRGGLVLAFSTLDGRPSSPDFDYSPVLQDWVTVTDIKVVFHWHAGEPLKEETGRADGNALRWQAGTEDAERVQIGERTRGKPRTGSAEPGYGRKEGDVKTIAQSFREKGGQVIKARTGGKRRGEGMHRSWKRNNKQKAGQAEDGHNVTGKEAGPQEGVRASSRKGRGQDKQRGWRRRHQGRTCVGGVCDWTIEGGGRNSRARELRKRRNNGLRLTSQSQPRSRGLQRPQKSFTFSSSLSSPFLGSPLSLSDLQVGGRCKCNGHASQCRRDAQGRAVCQCEHHTTGPDCDTCQPFYYDRPWQRATPTQPHPCVPCKCNGHSSKCRFSMEVFQQSGRRSGGVCLKCKHHTAGRHCQYCQNGYTRDHGKPLSHRKACRPCQCHPMGAVGRWCNQTSGQCLCRDGVTGMRCNRCAPGYQQGRSPIRPCLRIQEMAPTTPVYQPQYSFAEECSSYCQPSQVKVKMNLDTYCLKDYVLKVQVRAMERSGPWWQFSVWVQTVFRVGGSRVRRGQQALWVPDRDLGCGCPALQVGRTFLLIGGEDGQSWGPEDSRLVADRGSLALPWREHWNPKLRGFRGQDRRGRCPPRDPVQRNSTRSPSHWQPPHKEYTPPHLEHPNPPPHRSNRLPPTDTGLSAHAHPRPPHPTKETGSPKPQPHHPTHPPLQAGGTPQPPSGGLPTPDTSLGPSTQPSHDGPTMVDTRRPFPLTPTSTQPTQTPL
ncbi:hypothetical protein GJAV_G00197300 [Gymnothorax javanicus]|nr:hypothetical protein GJAV_G00197300 [Gymnothorax javanicus]